MKVILRGIFPARIAERSEEMRRLFDYAISSFGSVKVVNEFSKLPSGIGYEWGEVRYVEIPASDESDGKWGGFLILARKLNISVEPIKDPRPQRITW